jgi:hypothetical protein
MRPSAGRLNLRFGHLSGWSVAKDGTIVRPFSRGRRLSR